MKQIQKFICDYINIWTTSESKKKSSRGRSSSKAKKIYGIEKLRELILDLAIHGKLTVQDPTDEPASELLKKIELEQIQFIREKRKKPLQSINNELPLFKLPNGWSWVRNHQLFQLKKGRMPKNFNQNGKGLPYLDIEALDKNLIRRYSEDSKCPISKETNILVVCDGSRSGLILNGKYGIIGSTLSVVDTPIFIQPFVKLIFKHGFKDLNTSMKGAAIPHLDIQKLLQSITALPPLSEQQRIISKVDELSALCDQLEQQYINSKDTHNNLLKVSLDKLIKSKDSKDFKVNWQRIAKNFDTLFATEESINELKGILLQVAVMGRLVPQDPNDETADELLKKIQAEKIKLINKKKQSQDKIVQHIQGSQTLCKFPKNWLWLRLKDSYQSISPNGKQLKTSEIKTTGKFPVVDQGQSYIAGYTDLDECLIKIPHPVIVFGDHTRNIKFIDFNFAAGADGTKILAPILINPRFFYYYLLSYKLESRGYARHFSILNKNFIAIPPLTEQHRIVTKLDDLIILCDELKSLIHQSSIKQNHIADVLVSKVLNSKEV
jgi:type I restriction enzyme, S subunit